MSGPKGAECGIITLTKVNFHNVCRVCFHDVKPPLMNIFSSQFKGESVADIINSCIPNQIIDISLPNNICKECLSLLLQFKTFKSQFQYADTVLTIVRDQLNKGNQEVNINNFTKPDIGELMQICESKVNNNNLPSTAAVSSIIGNDNADKKSGILKGGQKPIDNYASVKSSSNLSKAKSKSSDNISIIKQKYKPVFSLPLSRTCRICSVDFFGIKNYETHMKETHPDKILKCSFCLPMKNFFDVEELKRHKIASHDFIDCKKCNSLVAKSNIIKHNEKIHANTIKMNINAKLDLPKKNQPEQKSYNINNVDAKIECGNEESQCKLHILRTEKQERPFLSPTETKFDNYSESFQGGQFKILLLPSQQTVAELKTEDSTITSTKPAKDKEMYCVLCAGISFSSYTKFEQHCSKYHGDTVSCNICQTTVLYTKEAFKLHKVNVHRFVVCQICLCTIKPEKMQKHMEIHADSGAAINMKQKK